MPPPAHGYSQRRTRCEPPRLAVSCCGWRHRPGRSSQRTGTSLEWCLPQSRPEASGAVLRRLGDRPTGGGLPRPLESRSERPFLRSNLMSTKRSKTSRLEPLSAGKSNGQAMSNSTAFGVTYGNARPRRMASARNAVGANEYLCALERNQNGKYTVRVRAIFRSARPRGQPRLIGPNRRRPLDSAGLFPRFFLQRGDEEAGRIAAAFAEE